MEFPWKNIDMILCSRYENRIFLGKSEINQRENRIQQHSIETQSGWSVDCVWAPTSHWLYFTSTVDKHIHTQTFNNHLCECCMYMWVKVTTIQNSTTRPTRISCIPSSHSHIVNCVADCVVFIVENRSNCDKFVWNSWCVVDGVS